MRRTAWEERNRRVIICLYCTDVLNCNRFSIVSCLIAADSGGYSFVDDSFNDIQSLWCTWLVSP